MSVQLEADLKQLLYVQVVRVSVGDVVTVHPFTAPSTGFNITLLNAQIAFTSKAAKAGNLNLDAVTLSKFLVSRFGGQVSRSMLLLSPLAGPRTE